MVTGRDALSRTGPRLVVSAAAEEYLAALAASAGLLATPPVRIRAPLRSCMDANCRVAFDDHDLRPGDAIAEVGALRVVWDEETSARFSLLELDAVTSPRGTSLRVRSVPRAADDES